MNRVNAAPIRRSRQMRASTASAWRMSRLSAVRQALWICLTSQPTAFWPATHAAIIALKRARLTTILGFALRQTAAISDPMCSPSLSQSVQIMRRSARRDSVWRLRSIFLKSWRLLEREGRLAVLLTDEMEVIIGASKRANGSHEPHFRWLSSKSYVSE